MNKSRCSTMESATEVAADGKSLYALVPGELCKALDDVKRRFIMKVL